MVTIALRRPVRTRWPALLAVALVAMAGGVVATAPAARAAQTPASCANSIGLVNGGFEQPAVTANNYAFLQQNTVPGWSTTATDNNIEIWHNPFNGVTAAAGTQHAELNATQFSTLYQDLPTIPGTWMRWSLAHRGRAGTDTMHVLIGAPGGELTQPATTTAGVILSGDITDGTSAWGRYFGLYRVPDGQTTTRFAFKAVSTAGGNISIGNFLDDISFGTNACVVGTQTVTSPSGDPYAQVGDLLTITVKADSGGGNPAMGTTVTSPIPPGVSFVPGSIKVTYGTTTTTPTDRAGDDVAEYDPATKQVTVRVGNGATATAGGSLINGEAGTVTYQVRVDPLSAPFTSSSESTVRFNDPLTGNDKTATTSTGSIVLAPIADLAVTLARTGTDPVVAGLPVTYTATLTNNGGPSTIAGQDYAYGTKLTSQLPKVLTNVTGTTPGGTCTVTAGTLTCTIGTLAKNVTRTVTVTGTVASDTVPATGGLVMTVTGSTGSRDLNPGNDTASVTDTVTARADVGVTLTATPSPVVAGTDITYTAVLTNRGPSTSRSIVLNDPVPSGTSNPRASVPGGTCSVPTSSNGTVQCTLPTLAAGASTSVTIVVLSAPSRTAAVQNTVTVAATTPDPAAANNTATVSSPITTLADVRAVLSVPADNVPLGRSFPYTLTVTNSGPSTAVNTQISYTAPPGFLPTTLPTNCSFAGCTIPSLAPGAQVVLTGTAQVATTATPGRATVTATATAATPDPNTADNTGSTFVYVGAPVLQVSVLGAITDTRRTRGAAVGDQVVWTYVVTNAGDSAATGLSVVPPGSTTAVPTTCPLGTLPKGATAACHATLPQSVTAADVQALAATTTVQVTASWVGGTEVRSPSASGSLATVLPSSSSIQGASLSGATTPGLQEAASRTDVAAGASTGGDAGQTAVAVGVLLSAAAGTALGLRPLRRRS